MIHHSRQVVAAVVVTALLVTASTARAAIEFTLDFGPTSTSSNNPLTGASGTVGFDFEDDLGSGFTKLTLTITNTTASTSFGAGATFGMLTGFGFDLLSTHAYEGGFIAGSYLDTVIEDADAQPFETLDLAVADNTNFNGGNSNDALSSVAPDNVDMVSFLLSGADASTMAAAYQAAFFNIEAPLQANLRFQQVNAGAGSDKLQFVPPQLPPPDPQGEGDLPEPVSILVWTGLASVIGVAGSRSRPVC